MEIEFVPGQYIFRRQDPANRFYLILEGKVELEWFPARSGTVPVQTAGPGDYLGWAWFLEPYSFDIGARIVEPTRAIFFYGTMLRQRCETDHHLGYEIAKRCLEAIVKRFVAFQRSLHEGARLDETPHASLISSSNDAIQYGKETRL